MSPLKAVLWDVDGTLAETERDGHRPAFNRAFEEAGLPWRWDEVHYGTLLAVTGGRERILHDLSLRPDAPPPGPQREALALQLHRRKNHWYAQAVADGAVALRPGVAELIAELGEAGCRQAIVTTTSRVNVESLLASTLGPRWRQRFAAVVCGEDVQHKKPDPEAYHVALRQLSLGAADALAIEDSPAGVQAAIGEGVAVIVTRSVYFARQRPPGATAIGPGLHTRSGWEPARAPPVDGPAHGRIGWADLQAWHAQARSARPDGTGQPGSGRR